MRFSIVIPTYNRCSLVAHNVLALEHQTTRDFEVVVADDGSTDETVSTLRSLSTSFPLTVLPCAHRGAGSARNAGAAAAHGEVLLFLDDDMEAHPAMLAEHDGSHRDGAEIVLGDIPLHPASPRNLLTAAVGQWARARCERLATTDTAIPLADLLTGQLSMGRTTFESAGGFDADLTRGGLFGGEDIDLGYRLVEHGHRVTFNPRAISYQHYQVDPAQLLRRAYEAGRAEEELATKYPDRRDELRSGPRFRSRLAAATFRTLALAPRPLTWPVRAGSAALARHLERGRWAEALFQNVRAMERATGARAARRAASTGHAVVLAYHALSDLGDDPVLADYGVPPERFASQLDALRRAGHTFIDLSMLLRALDGEGQLPAKAVLITFDDGYRDLLTVGLPVLAARTVPAVVFAVGGQVGGTNDWDHARGARSLALLDAEELRAVADAGVEVGAHGTSHRSLARLEPADRAREVEQASAAIEATGVPRPRALSYPHGTWSPDVFGPLERAGYRAAFTVTPGAVDRSACRYALPRIEVLAADSPFRLWLKVVTARWPAPVRERLLRAAVRLGRSARSR